MKFGSLYELPTQIAFTLGGLHLETTPFDVTECVGLGVSEEDLLRDSYTTLCDPRLNAEQALHVVDSFRDALS